MEKLIYLTWAPDAETPDAHRDRMIDTCADALIAAGALGLSMNLKDSDADVASPSPGMTGREPFTAQVSLWLDNHDDRQGYEAILARHTQRQIGYLVTESLYTDYGENRHARKRTWPDGERSPGVMTVTLLEKPDRFSYEDWIAHWYGTQSPISEAMQPRTRYVRNAVVHALTRGAPPYLGIVEEAWPSARHIEDPYLFYAASDLDGLAASMGAMLKSVTGFLDLSRIQNVTLSEYLLKTPDFEEL